jgi:UDP-GlcNAc:undecaprenyl-phosphate GlcNAc-1-phosphate transferase
MTVFALLVFLAGTASFVLSFLICLFGTRFLIQFLVRRKMTVLDYHKPERPQIPRPAGPAIFGGVVAGEILLFFFSSSYAILALALVTLISGIVGIVDDLATLGGLAKPLLLLIGGIPMVAIQYLAPGASVYSSRLYLPLFSHPTYLPILYPLLVIIAIPVTTNTINTIDVLNGVMSGTLLIAFVPVTVAIIIRIYLGLSSIWILLATLPLIASLLSFYFFFHRYPSKIFPGDSGALALGGAYGAIAIIGGVEIVAIIAILPAILNSFLFLSSVKKLVEHRQVSVQPTILLQDSRMVASADRKAPVTLVRLLVSTGPQSEREITRNIFKLDAYCAGLALTTALLIWVIPLAK